jgi:hypothetical protein
VGGRRHHRNAAAFAHGASDAAAPGVEKRFPVINAHGDDENGLVVILESSAGGS